MHHNIEKEQEWGLGSIGFCLAAMKLQRDRVDRDMLKARQIVSELELRFQHAESHCARMNTEDVCLEASLAISHTHSTKLKILGTMQTMTFVIAYW